MQNLIDPHTHTIHTHHAYSTLAENITIAAEKRLEAIAITDHFGLQLPWLMDKREYTLENHLKPALMPKYMRDVRVFMGAEVDITGFDGSLAGDEMPLSFFRHPECKTYAEYILATKDVVIASMHYFDGNRSKGIAENTQMYINVLARKGVDILGHPTRCGLAFDWEEVVAAAKSYGKMIELNNATLHSRPKQTDINRKLMELCAKHDAPIAVSSDAHVCFNVGDFGLAMDMLKEIDFPEHLIATRNLAAFETALQNARNAE
ncbi:MAG: PHP domain-containing protein [Defluviitaleaceae bacterium]|nr:PHP domain-containing protein [Defluviitaleaceae bacterium]